MKRVWIFVLCILLTLPCVLSVQAATVGGEYVTDAYGLLSADEAVGANAFYAFTSERIGCPIYACTYESTDERDRYIGDEFLDDRGLSSGDDVLLLIITKNLDTFGDDYYYDLYLYGAAEKKITLDEVDVILDTPDVYYSLKSGKLLDGILSFAAAAEAQYLNGVDRPNPYLRALPVAFIISAIIAIICCVCVKKAYSMKKKSVDYPLDQFASLELTDQSDTFMGSFVTRRVISSGSRGGSGSGGGGRGGGGGHAGGR